MRTITESASMLAVDCWAAHNYGLAVEADKRAARESAARISVTEIPRWFTPEFEEWVVAIGSDQQISLDWLIKLLRREVPPTATLSAWRYLHDVVDAALVRNENTQEPDSDQRFIAASSKQQRFLDGISIAWYDAVAAWNRLNAKRKAAYNERYKALLLEFIAQDFSPNRIGSHEEGRISELPVRLCEQVLEGVYADMTIAGPRKLRPIHLYALVATLEEFKLIPSGLRGTAPTYLGERCQPPVKVKKGYRPDPPRGYGDEYAATINITVDVLVRLGFIGAYQVTGDYERDDVKRKRTL